MDNEATHIVHLLKKGSADGFRKTAEVFGPSIFALVFEITGSRTEAEEVTSDTLMQVFRSIDTFDPNKGSLAGWMLRIARNKAVSALRCHKGDCSIDIPETIPAPDEEDDTQIELVKEAIGRCSDQERELIQLYYYDNLPLAEIAEITGAPPSILAVRLHRLRQKIKQYILQSHGR